MLFHERLCLGQSCSPLIWARLPGASKLEAFRADEHAAAIDVSIEEIEYSAAFGVGWPTSLETYGRVTECGDQGKQRPQSRVLVDSARSRGYQKRGAGIRPVPLEEALIASPSKNPDLVALDEALDRLSKLDARKGKVIELRFSGGLVSKRQRVF